MNDLIPYRPAHVVDLSSGEKVSGYFSSLVAMTRGKAGGELVSALVPWVCNRLRFEGSRRVYLQDLGSFLAHMGAQGIAAEAVIADKGLVDWRTVGDIQAVASPAVRKNVTPALLAYMEAGGSGAIVKARSFSR